MKTLPRPILKLLGLGTAVIAGVLFAAASFTPNDQPYGYVAPSTVTSTNVSSGNEVAFSPTFETTTWGGDITAQGVAATGQLTGTVIWKASEQLPAPASRRIFTTDGAGTVVPFGILPSPLGLSPAQLLSFWSPGVVDYLRGVRTGEGAGYRERTSLIGDIIHSNPVYVGKARAGYTFDGYPAFAAAQASRPGRVYVGANDGMLHAFDAVTGVETFAFIPTKLIDTIDETARPSYVHRYYVDGTLTSEDAYISTGSGSAWRTLLVGGLGAGGKTIFALDVTSAAAITSEDNSASGAGSRYLWEFTDTSPGSANLGYTYGRPSIVRMNSGQWAVVVANGYMSGTGKASLFILNASNGSVISEIVVSNGLDGTKNGLSSPSLIDINGDAKVDYAYAGDLNGNLWKFDLTSNSSGSWGLSFGGEPLFRTHANASSVRAPITTAPDVGVHPQGGVLVYVGTGRLFAAAESMDLSTNYVYGIWDKPGLTAASVPIAHNLLLGQTMYKGVHANGSNVRVVSNNQPDWSTAMGWAVPLLVDAPTDADRGERVLQDVVLRDGRVQFISNNPTVPKGENWFIQLDAITGGAPDRTILDITNDLALTVADNVDRLDGTVSDVPEDRVVARYAGFGLASRPTVVSVGEAGDTAVLNTIYVVDPVPPPPVDPEDPGVLGGHFDLDTSSIWYDFNKGKTDEHTHEWDDETGLTEINYGADGSQTPGGKFHEIAENITGSKKFFIIIGNAPYSWDGVVSINGTPTKVVEYDKMQRKHFAEGAAALQKLTVYSFNPTAADLAAGVVKMTDLRMTFSPYAILKGGIIPTETNCVRKNTPGSQNEYRNGALIVQAVDATNFAGSFAYNAATKTYAMGPSTAAGAVKVDVGPGKNVVYANKGLLWESSVFWHWKGGCYGSAGYTTAYKSITGVDFSSLVDAKGDGTKGTDATEPDPSETGSPGVAVQQVVATRQAGTRRTGRLYWHEEVLDR